MLLRHRRDARVAVRAPASAPCGPVDLGRAGAEPGPCASPGEARRLTVLRGSAASAASAASATSTIARGVRAGSRLGLLGVGLGLSLALACGSKPTPTADAELDAAAKADDANAKTEDGQGAKAEGESFAKPSAKPPPPPTGSYLHEKSAIYIQRCTAEHPCETKLQPEGEAHCRTYSLGAYEEGWRLPTLEEAKLFAGIDALENKDGFHWTSTPYQEDEKQAWIVDPTSGQSTTVPRDRKPFTIRCVYEP